MPGALDRLLAAVLRAGALDVSERGEYVLAEGFARRLFERPWYGQMVKGAKAWRMKMMEACGWIF